MRSHLSVYVETVVDIIDREIYLGKLRGEGALTPGTKAWTARLVQAHRSFLLKLGGYEHRLGLWNLCAPIRTRSDDAGVDIKADSVLSLLVLGRCIPTAVAAALSAAHGEQSGRTHADVVSEAISSARATIGCFSRVESLNLRYLTGFVINRLRDKVGRLWYLSEQERTEAVRFVDWMDSSEGASLPAGSHHSPTTRLVQPQESLAGFVRRLEGFLQRFFLRPAVAEAHGRNLFVHVEEALRDSTVVRKLWTDVQCKANMALRPVMCPVEPAWTGVSAVTSVGVLQAFVEVYLLSKQKTWRLGMGIVAEAANEAALRLALKANQHSVTKSHLRVEENVCGLAQGSLQSIVRAVVRLSNTEAFATIKTLQDAGALQQRAVLTRGLDQVGDGAPGGATSTDRAHHGLQQRTGAAGVLGVNESPVPLYAVFLPSPDHGIVFEEVNLTPGGPASAKVVRVVSVPPDIGQDGSGLLVVGPSLSITVGDYVIDVTPKGGRSKQPAWLLQDHNNTAHRGHYGITLYLLPASVAFVGGVAAGAGKGLAPRRQVRVVVPDGAGAAASASSATTAGKGPHRGVLAPLPTNGSRGPPTPGSAQRRGGKRAVGSDTPGNLSAQKPEAVAEDEDGRATPRASKRQGRGSCLFGATGH